MGNNVIETAAGVLFGGRSFQAVSPVAASAGNKTPAAAALVARRIPVSAQNVFRERAAARRGWRFCILRTSGAGRWEGASVLRNYRKRTLLFSRETSV